MARAGVPKPHFDGGSGTSPRATLRAALPFEEVPQNWTLCAVSSVNCLLSAVEM